MPKHASIKHPTPEEVGTITAPANPDVPPPAKPTEPGAKPTQPGAAPINVKKKS